MSNDINDTFAQHSLSLIPRYISYIHILEALEGDEKAVLNMIGQTLAIFNA
jgi:hypothetical protein